MTQHALVSVEGAEGHPRNRCFVPAPRLDDRFVHVVGVFLHLVELIGNLEQGRIRICADLEHQIDIGQPVTAFAFHLVKSLYVLELIFLHIDDLPFDL